MGCLKIHMFGSFDVRLDGQSIIQFDTEKTRALLAYLASESDHSHQREYLAEMFWPERPPGAARANLQHHMSYIAFLADQRRWLAGDQASFADLAAAAHRGRRGPRKRVALRPNRSFTN